MASSNDLTTLAANLLRLTNLPFKGGYKQAAEGAIFFSSCKLN